MGIVSFSPFLPRAIGLLTLLAPLSALTALLAPAPSLLPHVRQRNNSYETPLARTSIVDGPRSVPTAPPTTNPKLTPVPCLKIIRHIEAGATRSCAGKLVVSGRMSDVCAALERMAG